jgi:hypothetical protein
MFVGLCLKQKTFCWRIATAVLAGPGGTGWRYVQVIISSFQLCAVRLYSCVCE